MNENSFEDGVHHVLDLILVLLQLEEVLNKLKHIF